MGICNIISPTIPVKTDFDFKKELLDNITFFPGKYRKIIRLLIKQYHIDSVITYTDNNYIDKFGLKQSCYSNDLLIVQHRQFFEIGYYFRDDSREYNFTWKFLITKH